MSAGRAEGAAPLGDPGLLSAIVEGTPDAVFVKDLEGRYLMVNSACARILGRPREEIVGRSDAQILPPGAAERLAGVDRLVMGTGEASSYEEVLPVGGRLRTFLSTKSVYRDAAGNALGIIGISRDITERKRAEEALREAREAERARMARDLHDGVLQDLSYTAASMGVMMLDAKGTEQEGRLQRTIDAVRRAAQGMREAVNDLRIEEELDRPFPELVGTLVEEARAMDPGCEFRLEVREGVPKVALGEAGVELSRVIREALTNARRHSGARSVDVALLTEGDDLVAEVSDDGRGLGQGAEPGMGTRSMRARARRLGGELAVESTPGGGTLVRALVPMRAALRGARRDEAGPDGPGR